MSLHEINRLAALFQLKYALKAEAAPRVVPPKILEAAKDKVRTAWKNYVNTNQTITSTAPTMIMHLANNEHPYAKAILKGMNDLVDRIDQLTPLKLFNWINRIAKDIEKISNWNSSGIMDTIHDNVRVTRQPEANLRELIKNKFGHQLVPLSSMLVDAANLLARALLKKPDTVAKKAKSPPPMGKSKDQLRVFMQSNPDAARYGLDSEEVFRQALERNRPLIEKFIRSLKVKEDPNRPGKYIRPTPTTGPEVLKLTNEIKRGLPQGTNVEALEQGTIEPAESLFLEPPDEADEPEEHIIEGDPNIIEVEHFDPMVDVRQKEKVKQEDEERKKRQEEFEMKQNSKYAQLNREIIFLRKVGL